MKKLICSIVCVLFLMPVTRVTATELVFSFINPSFGGSPFNGQWMLAQAQAQNKHTEKKKPFTMPTRDPIQDFKNSLNRQILYKLSSQIVNTAFGEEGFEPGHYNLDDYTIDVSIVLEGIRVVITDTATGGITTIEIPYY